MLTKIDILFYNCCFIFKNHIDRRRYDISKVVRKVGENGFAVILKNNKAQYNIKWVQSHQKVMSFF